MNQSLSVPEHIERQLRSVSLDIQQESDPAWVAGLVLGWLIDDARTHMSRDDVVQVVAGALQLPPDDTVVD